MDAIARGVLEKHLGRAVLTCLERLSPEELDREAQGMAEDALKRILDAVNDLEQDDFTCMDAIIEILTQCGYPVRRHEF